MKIVEVIESRVWINKLTNMRVSPYGACPWTRESDKPNWELITEGWTWRNDNGTVGLGRMPAKTREEAEQVMQACNNCGR
jgi:hypothetical protein